MGIGRDISKRKKAEEELQKHRGHQEETVYDQISKLKKTNQQLRKEITNRRQAEEQLHLLSAAIEQSTEGIAVFDPDGCLLYANESFASVHGYKIGELLGEHFSIFHTKDQMEAVEKTMSQIQTNGSFVQCRCGQVLLRLP